MGPSAEDIAFLLWNEGEAVEGVGCRDCISLNFLALNSSRYRGSEAKDGTERVGRRGEE
tara:strand:+ start:102 stop:278 length:177 start_codon:yes stop_codon:yes gene_type:complete